MVTYKTQFQLQNIKKFLTLYNLSITYSVSLSCCCYHFKIYVILMSKSLMTMTKASRQLLAIAIDLFPATLLYRVLYFSSRLFLNRPRYYRILADV